MLKLKIIKMSESLSFYTQSICNLNFNVPNEIPVVFHNGSDYHYHFIIKELANEFEGQSDCLGENKE